MKMKITWEYSKPKTVSFEPETNLEVVQLENWTKIADGTIIIPSLNNGALSLVPNTIKKIDGSPHTIVFSLDPDHYEKSSPEPELKTDICKLPLEGKVFNGGFDIRDKDRVLGIDVIKHTLKNRPYLKANEIIKTVKDAALTGMKSYAVDTFSWDDIFRNKIVQLLEMEGFVITLSSGGGHHKYQYLMISGW